MTLVLRPACADDIAAITSIYAQAVSKGTSTYELDPPDRQEMLDRFQQITRQGYPYLVAVEPEHGTVLGYGYVSAFRARPAYRFLVEDSIYLAEQAQGRGIGKALLAELVVQAEARGFRQMIAVVGGANPASIGLHRSLGFSEIGRMTGAGFKHGGWLDTVLMQCALGKGDASLPDESDLPAPLRRQT
jgi:L-amino acid N-acyltransferase YncA